MHCSRGVGPKGAAELIGQTAMSFPLLPRLNLRTKRGVLLSPAEPSPIVCDVGSIIHPDAATVDALARFQLVARRTGRQVRLAHASPELRRLLTFMGLEGVLPVEPERQAEAREDGLGVEEERELDDPAF
jgi:anti-anti-sigma regulatory factor